MKATVNGIQVEGTPKEVHEFVTIAKAKQETLTLKLGEKQWAKVAEEIDKACKKLAIEAERVRPRGYSL